MKLEDYLEGKLVSTFDEMVDELRIECAMDEKVKKNEFGEKVEAITNPYDFRLNEINTICRDLQINPFEDGPKIDRIKVSSLESVNDGDHYVLTVSGGANGGGGDKKWQDYFMLIRKLFAAIAEKFHTRVWMVDWKNDCADDVWDLRLGFEDNQEKEAQKDKDSQFLHGLWDLCAKKGKKEARSLVDNIIDNKIHKCDFGGTSMDFQGSMELISIADEAIRESEMVETEDGGKELERLKQMVRMRKISKDDFKTGLAGLYAAGLITMNQFDVAKRQFR